MTQKVTILFFTNILGTHTQSMMTPPTKENTLRGGQTTVGTVPGWYNKLKDNLRK